MSPLRSTAARSADEVLAWMADFNQMEQIPWSEQATIEALQPLLADASLGVVHLLWRDEAEEPIGYFVLTWGYDLEWAGRDAFLTELYLVPEARGLGLGARALAAVEEVARAHGVHAIHLMVRPENLAALRLYTRAGYESPPRVFLTRAVR